MVEVVLPVTQILRPVDIDPYRAVVLQPQAVGPAVGLDDLVPGPSGSLGDTRIQPGVAVEDLGGGEHWVRDYGVGAAGATPAFWRASASSAWPAVARSPMADSSRLGSWRGAEAARIAPCA